MGTFDELLESYKYKAHMKAGGFSRKNPALQDSPTAAGRVSGIFYDT